MSLIKRIPWRDLVLFILGVFMVVSAVFFELPNGVAVPLLFIGAGLAVAGMLLPRIRKFKAGPVEIVAPPRDEAAAFTPPEQLPTAAEQKPPSIQEEPPLIQEKPSLTPDFTMRQGYLDAAPGGIDARYAWKLPGGDGNGVSIILIGATWYRFHEALRQHHSGLIGAQATDTYFRNFGTALAGVLGGSRKRGRKSYGITGICPEASLRAMSTANLTTDEAIRLAAEMLKPGDIIFIVSHRSGPRNNFAQKADQRGYIPVEWWPDDFDAIKDATSHGIIVLEPAGNGADNLDDPLYQNKVSGFPIDWANPFDRSKRDSGAIIVGAGAPPPGTHGRSYGPDRSRLGFSNYGSIVDVQAWGNEVTTAGYGDLQGGSDESTWYTDAFDGTTAATAIVAGALACIQGVLRSHGKSPLSPEEARDLLRSMGSPQEDAPERPHTQRIGPRPDLSRLIPAAVESR